LWSEKLEFEDLTFVEEAFEFSGGGFRAVGGVADVDHHVLAEVAADGSSGSFFGVCWSEEVADFSDGSVTFKGEGDDGGATHEGGDVREEGLVGDVGVVLGEDLLVELHHFDSDDFEACVLEASEDVTREIFLDSIGFKENKRGF